MLSASNDDSAETNRGDLLKDPCRFHVYFSRFPRSKHHDPELGSLNNSFCPSVSVKFFENRGDVKFDGVEGNP